MQSLVFLCLNMHFPPLAAVPAFPDRLTILELLEKRHFDELGGMLQSFQRNYEQGKGDERQVAFVLETMANSNPRYEALMNEWVGSAPGSFMPYLVRAYYYYGVAWSWRGHRERNNTSAERLQKMQEFLQLAATDITTAIKLKPRLSAADALAVRILMMLGDGEDKKQTVAQALDINPATYLVRSSYLWSLQPEWGGKADELMRFMQETRSAAQHYPRLKPLMGYADYIFAASLAVQKRYDAAAIHFDFAVKNGADHIIYRQRGVNYYHRHKYKPALTDFNRSLALWPQNPKALRWRAYTLERLQRNKAALADLGLAVRLAPLERYTLMAHAMLLRKMGRYENVLHDYKQALYYNQEDADIWFARGTHYAHELMNFEAAGRDLKRATELDPDKPEYWYEYAAVLHYENDCKIAGPLKRYLRLCDAGRPCHAIELRWVRHAQDWLKAKHRCASEEADSD